MIMKSIQVAAVAVVLAILTACSGNGVPGSGSSSASPSASPVNFSDPVGDVPVGRPDISAVTVAKHGQITFSIQFVNTPPLVTDAKSSGFWDLLVINLSAIKSATAVRRYKIMGGTPTVQWEPLLEGVPLDEGVGSLPEHLYLYCEDDEGEGYCQGKKTKDIGPLVTSGNTLTVSVDPALLGDPTSMTFHVGVTRGTDAKLPEYSAHASQDWAPELGGNPWEWTIP